VRLQILEITDFGPYRGTQRFEFAAEPGVELVWGSNGRGKTSLLNTMRWALFGTVLGRGGRTIPVTSVGNREETDPDTKPFRVALTFTHDGHQYRLTRAYRNDPDHPASTSGFRITVSLVKDGDALGPIDRDRELARLLPEQIARFFLFDTELLQEYEQLLTPGSEAGQKLKDAIERILGLPVLTQARDDVATHLADARRAQAKAAQKDKATQALGNDLQVASEEAEQARRNVEELVDLVTELKTEADELEKTLTSNNRFKSQVGARNAKRDEVERLATRSKERAEALAAAAGDTWRAVLAPLVARELTAVDIQLDATNQRLASALAARQIATAAASGVCPTCRQTIDADVAQELHDHHDGTEAEDVEQVQSELGGLRARRDTLRTMRADGARIARLEEEASQARVDLSDAEGQLRELQAELDEAPPGTAENIGAWLGALASTNVTLDNTRRRLSETRNDLQRKDQAVVAFSEKLRRIGTAGSGAEDRKVQLLVDLHALLVAAVDEFRDRLRDAIEDEATAVFRALSAEPDYDRLRINENYGLTILYASGTEVLNRSSGYEHLVALSLIAALQRRSPMSGPIITDNPFGRLDPTHKKHVLQALPEIAEQVMLLPYEDEIDRPSAIAELGDRFVGEHHLRRVSGTHTVIEPGAYP